MVTVFTQKDYKTLAWKNGGGTTLELFRIPHSADSALFHFRLSIAQVEKPGPFSLFKGIDRQLLLLKGKGMRLLYENSAPSILDKIFQQIHFRGEEPINCELLDGPTEDFNVMIDRKWGKAIVTVIKVKAQEKFTPKKSGNLYIFDCLKRTLTELNDEVLPFKAEEDFDLIQIQIERTDG